MWFRKQGTERRTGERGVTTVEYGLIIAGVGIAAIASIFALRNAFSTTFNDTLEGNGVTACAANDPNCTAFNALPAANVPAAANLAFTVGYTNISASVGVPIATQTPTVTGGYGTRVFTVTPALPSNLSLSGATGAISGTVTATQSAATYTVTVTDSSGSTSSSLSISAAAAANPVFTVGYTAIVGAQNVPITPQTPTVVGGSGTRVFSISPSLSAGLSFDSGSGGISGTPTALQSTRTHTITVTDGSGTPATTTVSITVQGMLFSTGYNSISATRGTAITTQTPVVTGGTIDKTYAISPALSAGLTLNPATGAISGTPTAGQAQRNHTVTVTDSAGATATTTVSVSVVGLSISGYGGGSFARGSSVTLTPAVVGSIGNRTYALTSNGAGSSLPAGLSLDPSTGVISGTATTAKASTSYTIEVTDTGPTGTNTATTQFTLAVTGLTLTGYSSQTYARGQSVTQSPTVTGAIGSLSFALTSNGQGSSLPAGLTLNSTSGVISGLPTSAKSSANYTVTVTDSSGPTTATAALSLEVTGLTISNYSDITTPTVTTPAPTVTGSIGTRTFSVSPTLPSGFSISASTGVISGTTSARVNTQYAVTVTDTGGGVNTATTSNFRINVN